MNKPEYLLVTLAEECGEVAEGCCKALRFGIHDHKPGDEEDNRRVIQRELGEVMAVAEMLGIQIRVEDKVAKRKKLEKYMGISRELGTLTE